MGTRARETEASSLTTGTVVLLLGLGVLAVTLVLGLYALSAPDSRGDVLEWVETLVLLVAGGGATAAAVTSRRALNQAHGIRRGVEEVEKNTNGRLTARIQSAVADALAQAQATTLQVGTVEVDNADVGSVDVRHLEYGDDQG